MTLMSIEGAGTASLSRKRDSQIDCQMQPGRIGSESPTIPTGPGQLRAESNTIASDRFDHSGGTPPRHPSYLQEGNVSSCRPSRQDPDSSAGETTVRGQASAARRESPSSGRVADGRATARKRIPV